MTDSKDYSIASLMSSAKTAIDAVAKKCESNSLSAPYIQFKINGLSVSTIDTDRFKNLIMSLTNEKTGSGQCNKFRLMIAYAPQLGDDWDINRIDRCLTVTTVHEYTVSSLYCELTYGYADDADLRTTTYKGLLTDYDVDIQDGMLVYTIVGYSGIAALKESKTPISFDTDADGKIRPTEAVRQIVEYYLKPDGKHSLSKDINYEIVFDPPEIKDTDAPIDLPTNVDKNPAKAIDDILKKAVHNTQVAQPADDANQSTDNGISIADTNKIVYNWYISDASNDGKTGTIVVTMDDPNDTAPAQADVIFNWMSPRADGVNFLVKQFQPQFRGIQLLALAQSAYNPRSKDGKLEDIDPEELYTGSYFVKDDGTVGLANESYMPVPGGSVEAVNNNIESGRSTWVQAMQYPYKATMVLQGIPAEIPLTGLIKVVPLIYGQEHHSAGVYMVETSVDQIDMNGFSTTLQLLKRETTLKLEDQQNNVGEQADNANQPAENMPTVNESPWYRYGSGTFFQPASKGVNWR